MNGLLKMQMWFVYLIALKLVKTVAELLDFVESTFFISNGGDRDVLDPAIREFLLNPWVGLSSDEFDLSILSIDDILENEITHEHVEIEVGECLVNLAKKGWSPGLLVNFIWNTFDDFRSFSITDEEILQYLIKPDLELVIEMKKLKGYKKSGYGDDYQKFFDSLRMADHLLDDNQFDTPKDKGTYNRIMNLVELAKGCMRGKIINAFVDERAGDKNRKINKFKSDRRTQLILRVQLDDLYQRIRND